ncbi:hypothetical protein L1049_015552 [Liquidambar formosana]|uniref:Sieve element occlusion N-terminal domain-containing protein n=1 Tax=Liquidambar formosana TaxID=63359 RepID=A0AAP0X2L5_LIQFO
MPQSGEEQSNTNEKPSVAAATGGKQDTSAAALATVEKENTNAEANVTVHVEKKDPITASTVPIAENKNTNAAAVVAAPAASAEIQNATDVCDEKFPTWDNDAEMMKQIKDTHGRTNREIDMKPLLQIIKDVLDRVASNTPGNFREIEAQLDAVKDKALQATLKDISDSMRGISCEISCKCPGSGRGGVHATSMALLITLSKYSWDAKAVIALAAFAANYAKFWPTAQQIVTDPQHATSFIDHLPGNFADIVKPNLEALRNLMKVTVEVTKCIIEFKDKKIAADCPGLSDATHHFPAAVYWTVRSIVACASQLVALIGMGHEYIQWTMEAVELLSLAHMVGNIHSYLMKKLNKCHQHMACAALKEQITGAHGDNLETLKPLIYNKSNQHLIIDGSTKEQFVKEEWKFNKSPLMVLVDSKGMVRDPKNLHMIIWSWETMELSFTIRKDEDVWNNVSWNMDLLAGTVSTKIATWGRVNRGGKLRKTLLPLWRTSLATHCPTEPKFSSSGADWRA